jgi:hypothetical protein
MSLFMVAPMAAWMRVRGCAWRECGEMAALMLLPAIAALVMRLLDLPDAQLWISSSEHILMLAGVLVYMLYRREHYTRRYSLFVRVRRPGAELPSLTTQSSQPGTHLEAR